MIFTEWEELEKAGWTKHTLPSGTMIYVMPGTVIKSMNAVGNSPVTPVIGEYSDFGDWSSFGHPALKEHHPPVQTTLFHISPCPPASHWSLEWRWRRLNPKRTLYPWQRDTLTTLGYPWSWPPASNPWRQEPCDDAWRGDDGRRRLMNRAARYRKTYPGKSWRIVASRWEA